MRNEARENISRILNQVRASHLQINQVANLWTQALLQQKTALTCVRQIEETVEDRLEIVQRELQHQGQECFDEVRLNGGDVGRFDGSAIFQQMLEQSQARARDGKSSCFVLKKIVVKVNNVKLVIDGGVVASTWVKNQLISSY